MPSPQSTCHSVLCLDFDGVLHRASDAIHVPTSTSNGPLLLVQLKAQRRLIWLDELAEVLAARPEVAILVHSTWRRKFDQATLAHLLGDLQDRVIQPPGYFVDLTASAPEFIRQSLDWINEARREANVAELSLQEMVVLDDRPEFFASDEDVARQLVLTNPDLGLSSPSTRADLALALDRACAERAEVGMELCDAPSSKF